MQKLIVLPLIFLSILCFTQPKKNFVVMAYYSGHDASKVDSFAAEKLTHIIFSFCHLQDNQLHVDNANDTAVIQKLVGLKKRNPQLKVLLSLGGWGGCPSCSDIFSTGENRKIFAQSVKELSGYFHSDGIDLDWEYPAIEGYPGHKYGPEDKANFTELIKQLRKTLGKDQVISFAAGGFNKYIEESVDWKEVVKKVDYINLMTYDLTNGYSKVTGHHTPLCSTSQQIESTDNAVTRLIQLKVPPSKMVIGAAFYGRMWQHVPDSNHGLYQRGDFLKGISYHNFSTELSAEKGFTYYWDSAAKAPYLFNSQQHLFVTYDDTRSMELKTKYAYEKKLGGIMFWELTNDLYKEGLLDAIDKTQSTIQGSQYNNNRH